MYTERILDSKNVQICDIYRLTIKQLDELKKNPNYKELIDEYAESKKRFSHENNALQKSAIVICFSKTLQFEIAQNKDVALFDLKDIREFIKWLCDNKMIGSKPLMWTYFNVISKYTEWAYYSEYRNDYYTMEDIANISKDLNIVNFDKDVYTVKEMYAIADCVLRLDVKISLYCMIEGLKADEILSLKRIWFKDRENHEIELSEDRKVKLSDKLYEMIYEFSNDVEILLGSRAEVSTNTRRLKDSEYVMRASVVNGKNQLASQGKMAGGQFASNIRLDLDRINVDIEARMFRSFAMLYDGLKGMNIEDINIKYGTKYRHISNVYRNKEMYNKMKEKIELEEAA